MVTHHAVRKWARRYLTCGVRADPCSGGDSPLLPRAHHAHRCRPPFACRMRGAPHKAALHLHACPALSVGFSYRKVHSAGSHIGPQHLARDDRASQIDFANSTLAPTLPPIPYFRRQSCAWDRLRQAQRLMATRLHLPTTATTLLIFSSRSPSRCASPGPSIHYGLSSDGSPACLPTTLQDPVAAAKELKATCGVVEHGE